MVRSLVFLGMLGILGVYAEAKIVIVFLAWFLMFETYFHFKFSRLSPLFTQDSCTLQALSVILSSKHTVSLLAKLSKFTSVQFILKRINAKLLEIPVVDVSKDELLRQSFEVVREVNGSYITPADLFAAYLIYIEQEKRFLFSKDLKMEEFLNIVRWTRFDFSQDELPSPVRVRLTGEGIGEEMVYGWTIETKKYMQDKTESIRGEKPVLIGRDTEYTQLVETLLKKENNNALLIGEAGSGRTTLVNVLCYQSYRGELSPSLNYKRLFELMAGTLLAGASDLGILEERLKIVIEEIKHSGNVILYIPNFENILGASTFHLDLSGVLLPYLKDGTLRIIAAVTPGNYKLFVENRTDLVSAFELIHLEEPSEQTALRMLLEQATTIERAYKVTLTYKAIATCVLFAKQYLSRKVLPGSAMTLLSDSANRAALAHRVVVTHEDVIRKTEEITHVPIAKPRQDEKELLLNLEENLHKRVIGQKEAIGQIADAMRRIRTGLASQNKPSSFLFLGPTGVGKTETAKALAMSYFGSEDYMIRLDMSEYVGESGIKRLLGASLGEGHELGELSDKIFDNPFSLVLLDEFEKADPKILNLFLQVLDDGRLTDNKGRTVSFANAIVIATSNAGAEFIKDNITDVNLPKLLLDFLQSQKIFKPELLNRFDAIVVFKPLRREEIKQVVRLLLLKVSEKMKKQDIEIKFDEAVVSDIAKAGYDLQFGARTLLRYIQDTVEEVLSKKLLMDEIRRGTSIVVSLDPAGKIDTFS